MDPQLQTPAKEVPLSYRDTEEREEEAKGGKTSRVQGYITVCGSVCVMLFTGNFYLWGNISDYVVSYFHYAQGSHTGDRHATLSAAAIVIPLSLVALSVGNIIGAQLLNIMHVKLILLIGSVISLGAIFAATFMHNWWVFVVLYAFVFPFGAGLFYSLPMICGWEWFPERRGFISGLIFGSFGFASFIFGYVSAALVNKENVLPKVPDDGTGDKDLLYPEWIARRVPHMLRVCLICWGSFCIIALLTLTRNPEYQKKDKDRMKIIND